MGRVDSAQHTFRVNLNNPKHLLVHQTLMELNLDIHKSRANFIIECLYSVIKGTEPCELTYLSDKEKDKMITKREVMEMNDELRNDMNDIENKVMEKMTKLLLEVFINNQTMRQTPYESKPPSNVDNNNIEVDSIKDYEDDAIDETLAKMADMWSDS